MAKKVRKVRMYKGLPLIDATKDMEICVTKHDVSISRKNDPMNCAAANAIKRTTRTEAEVHISRTYLLDKAKKRWIRFITPESVSREITSFDRSAIFEPGDYVLKVPGPTQRLDYPRKSHTGPKDNHKTKKTVVHHTVNIRESAK